MAKNEKIFYGMNVSAFEAVIDVTEIKAVDKICKTETYLTTGQNELNCLLSAQM